MRRKTAGALALAAGVLGVGGLAAAAGAGHDSVGSVIRIGGGGSVFAGGMRGGAGGGAGVTVSINTGSSHAAHWLGTLTIDGCRFTIYECEDVEYELVKAFRREGYRASARRGVITVDYGRRPPRLRWHSHEYDLVVEDDGCGELRLCLHECHLHEGAVITKTAHEARKREIERGRDRDRHAPQRDDDRRRSTREHESRGRPHAPTINLAPYRPVTKQERPKIVGAWVPEPPAE